MDPVEPENLKAEEIAAGNKEPSFKLNEPVTMALNISPLINVDANEDESLSFIVLGKDSVEAQASLLASYVDIQQKSMSIDYKSMVSSLSIPEMQRRLTEVLQENMKMKETLRQNNEFMKQQFNTLTMWQEEVTKVHQSHKEKFVETKELINHLKRENTELKTKLWLSQHTDIGFEAITAISDSDTINTIIEQAELEQSMNKLTGATSKMAIEKSKDYITSLISEKFADKEQDKLQQLKIEKELESAMKSLSCNDSHNNVKAIESLKCSETCSAKDPEKAITTISDSDTINTIEQAELKQSMHKLTGATSKMTIEMTIEKYKDYVTSIVFGKFAKEQDKLQQLKVEKESAMKSSSCNDSHTNVKAKESLKCSETCSAKDQEIACLKESIALLEQKLQCVLTPVKLHDLSEMAFNLSRQKFVQNMKQYNDMLQELTECFVAQIERFAIVEKSLKEITDILRLDDDNSKLRCKEKLNQCCKQLTDEQVKIITDRQTLIKSKNQFQKIFSDYNSILYELEITIDENTKLNVLKDNTARENLQTSEQLELIKRDKVSLEREKRIFDQEKDTLKKEKQCLESQKKSLEMERVSLHDERQLLTQEKISLNEEKMSLDHQSQLYENCEKDLQNEKKFFQVRYEQLLSETNNLQQELKEKNAEFKEILKQLAQLKEEIELLRSQLTIYEEDFQQEKKLKEALLEEKNKLIIELQKQIDFNKQLQESASITNSSVRHEQTRCPTVTECPKCAMAFQNLPDLMKHLDRCLD